MIPLTLRPLSLYSIDLAVILTPAQLSCGLGLTAHVHRVKFLSPLEIHPPEDQSFLRLLLVALKNEKEHGGSHRDHFMRQYTGKIYNKNDLKKKGTALNP